MEQKEHDLLGALFSQLWQEVGKGAVIGTGAVFSLECGASKRFFVLTDGGVSITIKEALLFSGQ